MKRFSVILSAVALSLSASAQDITISGKPCVGIEQSFKCSNANRYNSFEWDFGDGSTSNKEEPTHKYSTAGTYTVTVTASGTNIDPANGSTTVTINNPPVIAFSCDTTGQSRTMAFKIKTTASSLKNTWSFGDGDTSTENNPTHKYGAPGTYNVSLTSVDKNGCANSVDSTIVITASSKVPNVFTPNGDGQNDYFMISANGARLKLEIFNRWGYKMFSRTGTENIVWDGYNPQGTLVSPGTYFYVITVEEGTTNYDPLNGYITVYY